MGANGVLMACWVLDLHAGRGRGGGVGGEC